MQARFGASAPSVASAGIAGWEGSGADPNSVAAAEEVGIDISAHRGRRLRRPDVEGSLLVLAMAAAHAESVVRSVPEAAAITFTLKELVRLLEAAAPPTVVDQDVSRALADRVETANALRASGFEGNPYDDDIADPLGLPIEAFRAMTWEIGGWVLRLDEALFGATDRARATDGA